MQATPAFARGHDEARALLDAWTYSVENEQWWAAERIQQRISAEVPVMGLLWAIADGLDFSKGA